MAVPKRRLSWCLLPVVCAAAVALATAQEPAERPLVGRLQGAEATVKGHWIPAGTAEGERWLVSGSEVELAAGFARILLEQGGAVDVCGPARFTVLKSGGGLTLALNEGRVQLRADAEAPVSVVTPFIVATPVAIGRDPRQTVVGLDATGSMCVLAAAGAVRLEHQFTGERLLVPQNGEFFLFDGRLEPRRESGRACRCEVPLVREPVQRAEQTSPRPQPQVTEPARNSAPRLAAAPLPLPANPAATTADVAPPELRMAAPEEQVTWQVLMPPLRFDAAGAGNEPPEDPQMALLIREVRLRPGVVFRGRVEGSRREARLPRETAGADGPAVGSEKRGGFFRSIGRFFKKIFGG